VGCWISPCYSLFSLGICFETYEPFVSLISKSFSGCGKSQITETKDTESADTGVCLYLDSIKKILLLGKMQYQHYVLINTKSRVKEVTKDYMYIA
jgi:hypothetical protein